MFPFSSLMSFLLSFSDLLMILSWNCQGAGSSPFSRALRLLLQKYRPNVLVILEPRISGDIADAVIRSTGFQNSHRFEATGFSGGIWVLWNDVWRLEVLESNSQFIHCRVLDGGRVLSYFTAVYGHPVPSRRNVLWDHLSRLNSGMVDPWVLIGDLNVIARANERRGGAANRSGVSRIFVDCCSSLNYWIWGLSDLALLGREVLSTRDWTEHCVIHNGGLSFRKLWCDI